MLSGLEKKQIPGIRKLAYAEQAIRGAGLITPGFQKYLDAEARIRTGTWLKSMQRAVKRVDRTVTLDSNLLAPFKRNGHTVNWREQRLAGVIDLIPGGLKLKIRRQEKVITIKPDGGIIFTSNVK